MLESINFNNSFITENVSDMSFMFSKCVALKYIDMSGFTTSNVTSMRYMFYSCSQLKQLDASMFDTSKVTDMGKMFNGCKQLSQLNLDGFQMENVSDKRGMFAGTYQLEIPDNICSHEICIPAWYSGENGWIEGTQCQECNGLFASW